MSCGKCGCKDIGGGSWTPDYCRRCGAIDSPGGWYHDSTTIDRFDPEEYDRKKLKKNGNAVKPSFVGFLCHECELPFFVMINDKQVIIDDSAAIKKYQKKGYKFVDITSLEKGWCKCKRRK